MDDTGNIIVTAIILTGLGTASYLFNRHIDHAYLNNGQRRPDGITALWVSSGVFYTVAGAAIIVGLWTHDWQLSAIVIAVHLLAFLASGLPMLWGDINRSAVIRTLRQARKTLRK